jgi:Flp pilus assembly protein TadG
MMKSGDAAMAKRSIQESGQSLVEIALVVPILLVLFLGIAEVGFFLFSHVQVANATRAGARAGSLCRLYKNCATLTTEVQSAVYTEASSLKMSGSNTKVVTLPTNPGTTPAVGTPITVTVTYTHTSPFISQFVPMFPKQLPIQHQVVMRFDR